ncbi:uncharacterized protein LOC106028856 isoform X2 [Cavia porcellus]|uniref:uncharacterized protein LOC106028856 isoform X2 n=1 Tax=Cavia porcellus TaxID=10141 RepID=UPI002FE3BC0E
MFSLSSTVQPQGLNPRPAFSPLLIKLLHFYSHKSTTTLNSALPPQRHPDKIPSQNQSHLPIYLIWVLKYNSAISPNDIMSLCFSSLTYIHSPVKLSWLKHLASVSTWTSTFIPSNSPRPPIQRPQPAGSSYRERSSPLFLITRRRDMKELLAQMEHCNQKRLQLNSPPPPPMDLIVTLYPHP